MAFQTKIKKARFVYSPFSAEAMARIGEAVAKSVSDRIHKGINADDQPAKALRVSPKSRNGGYPAYKRKQGLQAIRDWTRSGRTLRSMKVISVSEQGGKIAFADAKSAIIAAVLNKQERAFGISPLDRQALNRAVQAELKRSAVVSFKNQS